jgi:hypothetical protein
MSNSNMSDETIPGELSAIHDRLNRGDRRMEGIEKSLKENNEATARVETNTADLLEAFNALRGAFKVFTWIGKAAKPLGYIALAITAILGTIAAFKSGGLPK